jgi:hypothetical protein
MKFSLLLCAAAVVIGGAAHAQEIDWSKVDAALGRKAAVSGDVHRYGFPRTDLTVTLDGVTIKPTLALGGWVAFKPSHGGAMVMGDLVLLEAEINPVMTALIHNGLEITAIHNHILRGNPATFYMHVGGHGDPAKMATAILQALQSSKTPLAPPVPPATPPAIDLDTAWFDQLSASRARPMAGSISSRCQDAIRSSKTECSLRPLGRWALLQRSASSLPAAARRRSPAISC